MAPMEPPGPGGSPQPVVFKVYSDHPITGVDMSPPAMAIFSIGGVVWVDIHWILMGLGL